MPGVLADALPGEAARERGMKTVFEADVDLFNAALKFAAAQKAYRVACDREPGFFAKIGTAADHSPEWNAACDAVNAAQEVLHEAAQVLAALVNGETPPPEPVPVQAAPSDEVFF